MLRRLIILSVLFLYVSTTTGFALTVHFCGTKLSEVRVNAAKAKKCCNTEETGQPDKCCKDRHVKVKVSDQQQSHSSVGIPAVHSVDLFYTAVPTDLFKNLAGAKSIYSSYRGPPAAQSIPFTIRYSVFRI